MEETRYDKNELKASDRFKKRRDAIEALLKDGELYTIEQAEEIVEGFMKGRV